MNMGEFHGDENECINQCSRGLCDSCDDLHDYYDEQSFECERDSEMNHDMH